MKQIEKELQEAKARLERYETEQTEYNGDQGPERYLFFISIKQLINGTKIEISTLERQLKKQQESPPESRPTDCGL
ncbi:EMC3/TMCO1 family protein [Legionella fallonii]|uniref:Uncharacterized protein n=1 Tax=Legionella fallonii LLAP-10 TaxID=1212491 RepID=A0A098G238_9GAMM|nr:hypothetical protein [Legionella fallonii]CEG55560.1 protein of unknown function [coiled-coil domain] [Legionella fallonii LLAP-10]